MDVAQLTILSFRVSLRMEAQVDHRHMWELVSPQNQTKLARWLIMTYDRMWPYMHVGTYIYIYIYNHSPHRTCGLEIYHDHK
jgi:hypothetical protein